MAKSLGHSSFFRSFSMIQGGGKSLVISNLGYGRHFLHFLREVVFRILSSADWSWNSCFTLNT